MLLWVIAIGLFLIVLERVIPDQKLPAVKVWWRRVVIINLLQLGVIWLAELIWETFLPDSPRNQFFHYALCNPGTLRDEPGLSPSENFEITLSSLVRNDGRKWSISTPCQ